MKIIANGKVVHKTETKKKTLSPSYDAKKETVTIPYSPALKFIDVECWDWDRIGKVRPAHASCAGLIVAG